MNVKVLNFRSPLFGVDFLKSLQDTGFAVITHHGISFDLIKETQLTWKEFFKQPSGLKQEWTNHQNSNLGYNKFGIEKAVGAQVSDLKEFFHWKPGQRMPTEVDNYTRQMFHLLEDIGIQLLHIIDSNEETRYANECEASDNTILRTLYYPSFSEIKVKKGAVRAAAHEDINFLTLLVASSAPGLEVLDKTGKWYKVPYQENSIVVNVGDALQLASQGRFKSTTHRVTNPEDETSDRISMPLFLHSHSNTILAQGITAQQYLEQRLNAIYKTE